MPRFERALLGATFATLALSSQAQAHIDMVGDVIGRQGDQKLSPCDGPPTGKVYTFEPGATIKLQVNETIQHPSYYRIAFDDNGQDGFKEPATIDPIDPNRKCPSDTAGQDQCTKGKGDYCNVVSNTGGASVLWDYLDPHLSGGQTWTYTVTLPNVECSNCVIQVIQVMEDDYIAGFPIHGPFCPQGNPNCDAKASLEDIYHRCIDIKLQKGAGMTPGTVSLGPTEVKNNGLLCPYAAGSSADAGVPMSAADSGVVVIGMGSDAGAVDHGSHSGDGGVSGGTTGLPFDASTPTVPGSTPSPNTASSDDSGCAVSPGSARGESAGLVALALAGLFAARRRRRHAR
jgi:MYXO-CTERM domain-containing protein